MRARPRATSRISGAARPAARRPGPRAAELGARRRLRALRRASALAVALTGLALLLFGAPAGSGQEPAAPGTPSPGLPSPGTPPQPAAAGEPREGVVEATGPIRDLVEGFVDILPRLVVAALLLLLAGLITRVVKPLLRRILGDWEKAEATSAMAGILVWLVALGAALSVLAGDARALLGSIGLFGLALSWALQTPIESFTGWLMNSFKSYYRIGDRIAVGEVFGDVYQIDFLTTTVWEAGGQEKPVTGEQPTGALITFPNSEVLRSNIVNFTRGFPFVWDEVTLPIANESDLAYVCRVFEGVAREVVGEPMAEPAARYRELLQQAGLGFDVAVEPHVFLAPAEAWTDVTVRYLIPARERRQWSSALTLALTRESKRPEHRGRIITGYPHARIEVLGDGGAPAAPEPADRS